MRLITLTGILLFAYILTHGEKASEKKGAVEIKNSSFKKSSEKPKTILQRLFPTDGKPQINQEIRDHLKKENSYYSPENRSENIEALKKYKSTYFDPKTITTTELLANMLSENERLAAQSAHFLAQRELNEKETERLFSITNSKKFKYFYSIAPLLLLKASNSAKIQEETIARLTDVLLSDNYQAIKASENIEQFNLTEERLSFIVNQVCDQSDTPNLLEIKYNLKLHSAHRGIPTTCLN